MQQRQQPQSQLRQWAIRCNDIPGGVPQGLGYDIPRGLPQGLGYDIPRGVPQGLGYDIPRGVPQGLGYCSTSTQSLRKDNDGLSASVVAVAAAVAAAGSSRQQ